MTRVQRIGVWVGIVLGSILLVLMAALLVLTQTDWGREQVRRVVVSQLDQALDGQVEVGRLEGNLLVRWRFVDVSITDLEGRPFLVADTAATRFSIRGLLRRRIDLGDMRLVHAHVVLDQPPGEDWNYARILPEPDPDPDPFGWGHWVHLTAVEVVESRVTIRSEWRPDPERPAAERERKIAEALDEEKTRDNVQRVPGGFQNVMDFREITASLDEVVLADPDLDRTVVDVAALRAIAQPFRPPVADVRGLEGKFQISGDSLWFQDVRARLPGSRLLADGTYRMETGELMLRMVGDPAMFPDLRWLHPPLPEEGGGHIRLTLHQRQDTTHILAEDLDLVVGAGTLTGDLRMVVGDFFRMLPTDLRFSNLDSRPVARVIPEFESPVHGILDGRVALVGDPAAMRVNGDVAITHAPTGRSRVVATGVLGMEDEIRFDGLRVAFRPLRTDLIRGQLPRFPPGAAITGEAVVDGVLGGPLRVNADLAMDDPATGRSHVLASGLVDPSPRGIRFTRFDMEFRPLLADLVRPELPQLPRGSTIAGRLQLHGSTAAILDVVGDLALADPVTGGSRVTVAGGLDLREELRLRALALEFQPLRLDLVRAELPELPPGATLLGRLELDGDPGGLLRLDGDLTLQDPATGESRVAATGAVDLRRELAFRSLTLRLDPLQVLLLQRFEPDIPLAGTLAGTATLDGRPAVRLAVQGDLVHREAGELSRVAGRAEIVPGDWARVDVQLRPLSLVIAGRFVPEAGLIGEVHGDLQAAGDLGDLALRADLTVPGGGEIFAAGTLDVLSPQPAYDLATRLQAFDLAAITVHAPATTMLTGSIDAAGRGLDPATMWAEVRADLVGSRVDEWAADEVRLRLAIADGLARVDSSIVMVGPAMAFADGEFGLVARRDGELRYQVEIEELDAVSPLLPPPDTGVVRPRPGVRRAAIEEAREMVLEAERRRLVEAIATGRAPPPEPLPIDTPAIVGIPRDTVAGRLDARGVIRGNIHLFDLVGEVEVDELFLYGHHIGEGEADFAWIRRGVPMTLIELDARAERLMIEGFILDSALAQVHHRGDREGAGRAVLAAWQPDDTAYRTNVDFTLAVDRGEVLVHDLFMQFDTLTWQSVQPAVVSWDDEAVEVDGLELASGDGGLIMVDGQVPFEAGMDLHVIMREVELAHLEALLQDDEDIAGRFSLETLIGGTLSAPEFEGVAIVAGAARNDQRIPDARIAFTYGAMELTLLAELFEEVGRTMAIAEVTLPLDLAIVDQVGPRLAEGPLVVDVMADSLPLGGVGALTDQVRDAEGVLAGEFSIRGTWDAPVSEGEATVVDGAFRVTATNVRYGDVAANFVFSDAELVVDSLVGRARGPVRVTGAIDLSTLTEPGFDLQLTAENAWVMRTSDYRIRLDADLEMAGPFDQVAITGQARTRRSVIYVPETRGAAVVALDDPALLRELEGRLLEAAEALVDRPSPLLANLDVNVALRIEPDTWIRSTDYNVEIYTPPELGPLRVRLDAAAGRLTLEGTVNSDRGDYSFLGRRFRVARGAATFLGGNPTIDPLVQITAEHEVQMSGREDFSIRVAIGGTALNPIISVESDARPPIDDTQIFTYVALGRAAGAVLQQQRTTLAGQAGAAGDLVGNVAGLATQQMAAVAANTMLDEFESELARELGLDILHISPADLPTELFTGQFGDLVRGTEIEAGLYIGPRLFAAVRARPTTETRPGATVEYTTPGGFRFTTSMDPRYLPATPTLRIVEPERTSVFSAFVAREWRF